MAKPQDMKALIEVTKTTQTLLTHLQTSLAPATAAVATSQSSAVTELPNPVDAVRAAVTLLKSHTTTLSLLLLTPPFTPSALVAKITDVSSGALSGMVAAASYVPQPGQKEPIGHIMRTELRSQVRRLLSTWGDVLALVLRMADRRQDMQGQDTGPTQSERQEILSVTGVLWDACDVLLKVCNDGVVGLVVKKAEQLRAILLDAIQELKEWGEDIDEEEDGAEGSDDDEDDIFGASNKLGRDDTELKELLDVGLKRLKMIAMLYQALVKRRLKTYAEEPIANPSTTKTVDPVANPVKTLDSLMDLLKSIPETVDDLASAFYELDNDEAKQTLEKCTQEAKSAVELVKHNWFGSTDEFTAWSIKWVAALDAV